MVDDPNRPAASGVFRPGSEIVFRLPGRQIFGRSAVQRTVTATGDIKVIWHYRIITLNKPENRN
jgi:hypothetical protein